MQYEVTLAPAEHDLPKKGNIVVMSNGSKCLVADVHLNKDLSITYTLKRIKWYYKLWWWIKRQGKHITKIFK